MAVRTRKKSVQGGKPRAFASGRAAVEAWFAGRSWTPWPFQREAWDAFAAGESGLIQVGTGAGKTYAAYGGPLADLIDAEREEPGRAGLAVLYITPLRAVARDIEKALREPIDDLGLPFVVEGRTGDTAASVRTRQRARLPHVLVTTPESLTLLLTRETARQQLANVRSVIVDEWHELVSTKRGSQTELALARLRRFAPGVRVWGLSATLPNLEEAAAALVGVGRRARIVRGEMERPVTIEALLPRAGARLPWTGHLGFSMLEEVLEALDPERSTLVFTNTRSQAERWFHAISIKRPEWTGVMALHHGSIDRKERERIEGGLKSGDIRLVVATSSLDLGVDFTPVERVFQIGSPKGIARLVQRAGRSSHRPRTPCSIVCVPTYALELIEVAAARRALAEGKIEERSALNKPLDVLSQHMVTCGLGGGFTRAELVDEVRSAWSFRTLTEQEFEWCLELVRHGGGTLSAYPQFHRVVEVDGVFKVQSPKLAQIHRLNVGTITGDGTIEIRYVRGRSLGHIQETFVANLREGEKFVFAGKVLTLVGFHDMVALVRPARGTTNYTPIWGGTRLPISESLGEAMRQTLDDLREGGGEGPPEVRAAAELIAIQKRESIVPRAEEVLAEVCRSKEGTHLFVFPFEGILVHGGLAALLALRLARRRSATMSIAVNDYGFELLCPGEFPFAELLEAEIFSGENLVTDALESVNMSQLARRQFREVARIAGLVIQNHPGHYKTGRQLEASSGLIFEVLSEFDPGNLLLAQARREVLERQFESSRLSRALARLHGGALRIVETRRPTPLSLPLMVERLAGRLSTESLAQRVDRMRAEWDRATSQSGSRRKTSS